MTTKRATALLTILLPIALSSPAFSAEEDRENKVPTLEQVTVTGQREDPLTGSNELKRELLDILPAKNGSINEAISILPGVQLSDLHRTSDNAGEIIPPNLSISGGRIYENDFRIDGFGNNSLLDPTNTNIDNTSNVPGHPQQSFLHPSLVENITVYRSNIPAKYGNFTGGVVNVETRDPSGAFRGEVRVRHTRSAWTEFHISRDREEEYDNPIAGSVQPKFRKYDGSILLDVPITEQTGILASYSLVHSEIPVYQIKVPSNMVVEQDQYRSIENFFLKAVTHISSDTKLSITGSYNPYKADYFKDEVVNSDYTLENYAYGLTSTLEHRTDFVEIELGLGYTLGTNSRRATNQFFNWQVTDSKPWGAVTDAGKNFQYSKEGGFGDIKKEQQSLSAHIHIEVGPLGNKTIQNHLRFGASVEQLEGNFNRTEEFTRYTLARQNDAVVCEEGDIDCISNEQFMFFKSVYPKDKAEISINFYDTYIEERIEVGQLTLRPGLRVSMDDLQDNTNLAPRFEAGYDLFGDGRTNLYAGYNRYYGKTLMTHALEEQKGQHTNWRRSTGLVDDKPQAWEEKQRTSISAKQLSDLKTPYSDELTMGIHQEFFGGLLDINYLEREGENELASKLLEEDPDTGYKYIEWTNNGQSDHREASLFWKRTWRNHYLFIAATWQETEASNSDYSEYTEAIDKNDDGLADPVWYNGSLLDRTELPRPDFNRDFVGNLVYSARLPFDFTFTNATRYRSGYTALKNTGEDKELPSGLSYDIYDEIKQPESWIFDWTLEWEKVLHDTQSLTISAELNNVFNQKVLAGDSDDIYELGRQFWLGMTYKF